MFGLSTNSLDAPAAFLWDYQTTASDTFSVGIIVLALAVAGVGLSLTLQLARIPHLVRVAGVLLIAVAAAYLLQLVQLTNDSGASFGDVYGIGPFVTAVGGIGLLVGK